MAGNENKEAQSAAISAAMNTYLNAEDETARQRARAVLQQFGVELPQSTAQSFTGEELTKPIEAEVPIKRFSSKTREILERKKDIIHIYTLEGTTLKYWREHGFPFSSDGKKPYVYEGHPIESIPSMRSEVAIVQSKLRFDTSFGKKRQAYNSSFLKGAWAGKKFSPGELQDIIERSNQIAIEKDVGAHYMKGSVADYVELTVKHLDRTGQHLFGELHQYCYTRTSTVIPKYDGLNDYDITVGGFTFSKAHKLHHPSYTRGLDIAVVGQDAKSRRMGIGVITVPA